LNNIKIACDLLCIYLGNAACCMSERKYLNKYIILSKKNINFIKLVVGIYIYEIKFISQTFMFLKMTMIHS